MNGLFSKPGTAKDAIRELMAILTDEPTSAQAHLLLGLAYSSLGSQDMLPEAVAELRQAIGLDPTLVAARFYLARVYLDISQPDRAREEMTTALNLVPGRPEFLVTLAEAERRLGHPDKGVTLSTQAVSADPQFDLARYTLALCLIDLGRRDDAVLELERLVKAGSRLSDAFFTLGGDYLARDRVDEALAAFAHGLERGIPGPAIRIQLARALRLKGLLSEADDQLNQVFGPNASVQVSALYQQLETDLQTERGQVRVQQGRLEEAAAAFRSALEMDPDRGVTHRALAEVYLKQGRLTQASGEAARAKALGAPLSTSDQSAIDAGAAGGPKTSRP